MGKSTNNHLCGMCRRLVCEDCMGIADEYAELLERRTQALAMANHRMEEMERKVQLLEKRAEEMEKVARIGFPSLIWKWVDSKPGAKALDEVQRELAARKTP